MLLRSDCDIHGGPDWSVRDFRQDFAQGVRAGLSVFDGKSESVDVEFQLESPFPTLDRLPDGHWIAADSRCHSDEANARLLSPKGDVLRRFCLGDSIHHRQCDAVGGIWVGRFDEALFSEFNGLMKFDSHGQALWRSSISNDETDIIDGYALNVRGSTAWTYYYADFPMVEVDGTGRTRRWKCPVRGASALAVDGDTVLLADGYGEDVDRLFLLAPDRGNGTGRCTIPIGCFGRPEGCRIALPARGQILHIVRRGIWRSISVNEVRDALGVGPSLR